MSLKQEAVTCILKNNQGEFLLQQRDDLDYIPYPGYWVFPGGGIENEETPEATVAREMEEEFDLEIDIQRLHSLGQYVHDGQKDFVYFYEKETEVDHTNEGQDFGYFSFEKLSNLKLGFDQSLVLPLLKNIQEND